MAEHHYHTRTTWTGAGDEGTKTYKSYSRDYAISVDGKADILGSSDPAFRGDPARHNPEDMLVASVSACHMLWYLHLCSVNNIVVTRYVDDAEGVMVEGKGITSKFEKIILRPHVTIKPGGDMETAASLHAVARKECFVANSLNCPVEHEPTIEWAEA